MTPKAQAELRNYTMEFQKLVDKKAELLEEKNDWRNKLPLENLLGLIILYAYFILFLFYWDFVFFHKATGIKCLSCDNGAIIFKHLVTH